MREKSKEQDRRRQWSRWKDKTHEGIWNILEHGCTGMAKILIRIILSNIEIILLLFLGAEYS